jgi:hypothetical protein
VRLPRSCLVACVLYGCTTSGGLDLELVLPSEDSGLRPTGMTTITVLATTPNANPIANTAVLDGTHFAAGDLPVGTKVQLDVLLHDVSNRLVGIGEAAQPVDLPRTKTTTVTIQVRRPFVYASSGNALFRRSTRAIRSSRVSCPGCRRRRSRCRSAATCSSSRRRTSCRSSTPRRTW